MRYVILSDLHANLEALHAVLDHAAGRYDQALCCGDIIGYGADPNAVVDWVRANCHAVIRGNHDKAAVGLDDLEWFNPVAKAAALWTRTTLSAENAEYIRGLSQGPLQVENFLLVHGSPLDEDEYLVTSDDADPVFDYVPRPVSFFGHTHLQGGFLLNHNRVETIGKVSLYSDEQVMEIDPSCIYLINPGSVGQPRDNDARSAYCIFDTEAKKVEYRRVNYDIAGAQQKITGAGLPPVLAERLSIGR